MSSPAAAVLRANSRTAMRRLSSRPTIRGAQCIRSRFVHLPPRMRRCSILSATSSTGPVQAIATDAASGGSPRSTQIAVSLFRSCDARLRKGGSMSCLSSVIRFAMVTSLGLWACVVGAQPSCQLPTENEFEPREELRKIQAAIACMQASAFQDNAALDGKAAAEANADVLTSLWPRIAKRTPRARKTSRRRWASVWASATGGGRGPERIEEAEVVNGVVRVKRAKTDKPRRSSRPTGSCGRGTMPAAG